MIYYINSVKVGTSNVSSRGDGNTITVKWNRAYSSINHSIAYHIYYAYDHDRVFFEGVKYVSIDDSLEMNLIDLNPGQLYHVAVRPVEYNSELIDLNNLPIAYADVRAYPYSLLRENLNHDDLEILLNDVVGFPSSGVIKIGRELIRYSSVNESNSSLIVNSESDRGFNNSFRSFHDINGFDGMYDNYPLVSLYTIGESTEFDRIFICQNRFERPNYSMTLVSGHKTIDEDILRSDLVASDEMNQDFPTYDYSGYHRTDPELLLNGTCLGSYIGGEMGCIDGYGNINIYRGFSLQDHNNQRQEMLLEVTGRPAVLLKRLKTGMVCSCYQPLREYPKERCPICLGTGFVSGYEQFFNPRRADGRILVRFSPTEENLKMQESGLESEFSTDMWTLTSPTIYNRDIIIMFNIEDNEEFRYEVMGVTRNNTILGMQGGQKMKVQRIRKTDPAYQARVFRNTEFEPRTITTGIGMGATIPPHIHNLVINENITSLLEINQITSQVQGHTHQIVNGVVQEVLGHTHIITI